MSEREYTVIVNNKNDLTDIESELTASTGDGPIPNRSVGIANPRPGSRVQTHFMLTDEEANELRQDARIRAVEIPPEQRDDISLGFNAYQTASFKRSAGADQDADDVNWGLRRCNESTNTFTDTITTIAGDYEYALDGTGVDVVIQDSGIDADHPEWEDASGNSRLQQIDWYTASGVSGTQDATFYTDYDGHGTHCAGIAAGKTYGYAKNARIYAQKLAGLEGVDDPDNGISIANAFDTIRLWHNAKGGTRPTVVNMSWGYGATLSTDPVSGSYRGVNWTYGVDYADRDALEQATGVSIARFTSGQTTFFRMPTRVVSVDAEIEDMIDDGIHICIAAGNNYNKVDVSTGDDWNNTVTFDATTYNYHQGSSPYSINAFMVGNIDAEYSGLPADNYSDKFNRSSTRGPGVNIHAPGTNIMSTSTRDYDAAKYSVLDYPDDNTYKIMTISGTSMASPQVAGLVALHLQSKPDLTPAEMLTRIFGDSKSVIYSTASDTDYDQQSTSALGSPNRMLFNRYGKQPLRIKGA